MREEYRREISMDREYRFTIMEIPIKEYSGQT